MQKLKSKAWLILLVSVMVVIIIFFLSIRSKPSGDENNQGQEDVSTLKGAGYESLFPGQSTKPEVIEKLGEPLNDKASDILDFKSSNPNLPNKIVTENEKVVFIKEIITAEDGKTPTKFLDLYGDAPYVLYGPESIHGFNLYIYPDRGIAYLGHFKEPFLLEVWYFQPTKFEDFRDKWASSYTSAPQVRQ